MHAIDVVIVGAGQAGLATSEELRRRGLEHAVLDRRAVGSAWQRRWDSFCLVSPNWAIGLPGNRYDGADPDGYLGKAEIIAFLRRYAADKPVHEGVEVRKIEPRGDGFRVRCDEGDIAARAVVVATGGYQRPYVPAQATALPRSLLQITVDEYRNPHELPSGRVLVVGSGQSGCQIADDLHREGRDVVLACGRAPWTRRRLGGRDFLSWALETGFMDQTLAALADPGTRLAGNVLLTGRDGGNDLNLRTLHASGVTLVGHLTRVDGNRADFSADLPVTLAWGDDRYAQLLGLFRAHAARTDLPFDDPDPPEPLDLSGAPTGVDLRDFGAVIFAGGYRPDFRGILGSTDPLDAWGYPLQVDGASTVVPGLFFCGLHFQRRRRSATLFGVADDAAVVAERVARRLHRAPRSICAAPPLARGHCTRHPRHGDVPPGAKARVPVSRRGTCPRAGSRTRG